MEAYGGAVESLKVSQDSHRKHHDEVMASFWKTNEDLRASFDNERKERAVDSASFDKDRRAFFSKYVELSEKHTAMSMECASMTAQLQAQPQAQLQAQNQRDERDERDKRERMLQDRVVAGLEDQIAQLRQLVAEKERVIREREKYLPGASLPPPQSTSAIP